MRDARLGVRPLSIASYQRQIEAARAAGLALSRAQERAFLKLLEQYAEELASRVSAGLATRGEEQALAIATEIIQQLTRDMAVATRNGVTLSAERIADIYARATLNLMSSAGGGITTDVLGGIGARAAAAVLARPELAASFRSIQRDSVRAVDRILKRALLRGITGPQLGRELRLHVLGADAFPAQLLLDRRRIGYEAIRRMGYEATAENLKAVRKDAGQVAARAQLIARTEPMNAEWEVHRQGAIDSPVVEAIEWRLSGRHEVPDQCDVLAQADLYGLGPGRYDPRALPRRPHPRCLCLQIDVIADPENWGKPRGPIPTPVVDVEDLARAHDLTPSQTRSLQALLQPQQPPANRARPRIRVQTTVPTKQVTKAELRRMVTAREKEIAPRKVEWATAWDPNTGKQILEKTDNLVDQVSFTPEQRAAMKGAIMTHNHPRSSSFSGADVGFAIGTDLQEIRIASERYDYSLVRPSGGWPSADRVLRRQRQLEIEHYAEFRNRHGRPWDDEEWKSERHLIWREVFKEFGLSYRRTVHKP